MLAFPEATLLNQSHTMSLSSVVVQVDTLLVSLKKLSTVIVLSSVCHARLPPSPESCQLFEMAWEGAMGTAAEHSRAYVYGTDSISLPQPSKPVNLASRQHALRREDHSEEPASTLDAFHRKQC